MLSPTQVFSISLSSWTLSRGQKVLSGHNVWLEVGSLFLTRIYAWKTTMVSGERNPGVYGVQSEPVAAHLFFLILPCENGASSNPSPKKPALGAPIRRIEVCDYFPVPMMDRNRVGAFSNLLAHWKVWNFYFPPSTGDVCVTR